MRNDLLGESRLNPLNRSRHRYTLFRGGMSAARSFARSTMAVWPRFSASSTTSRNLLLCEFGVSIVSQKYVKSPCAPQGADH
jgi:hypothetical protein